MLIVKLILFVSGFVIANATSNDTCEHGLSSIECSGVSRCVTPCNTTAEFMENVCEPNEVCYPCRQGGWCDSLAYHSCPQTMASPPGSTDLNNCTCHRGHIKNGSTCTVCPEGSWCDSDGQHSCPSGMTSNLASVVQEDCYCLDTYNGSVNCADRANTTHHRCNNGYGFNGVQIDHDTGVAFDNCENCKSNYYCDGTNYLECPTQDLGVQYTYGKQTYADCFCPYGYTTLYGQGPCVKCPNSGVLNVSKLLWTRGVNCESLKMSKVTFTTSLSLSLTEFNSKREDYVTGVAQALWVPLASVVVGQVSDSLSVRRLLSTTIVVVNTVTIPSEDAQFVSTAVNVKNLTDALASRAMAVVTVSAPTVSIQIVEKVEDPSDSALIQSDNGIGIGLVIVLISCVSVFVVLVGIVLWRVYNKHKPNGYTSFENLP
jgi:hypothetical protein